MTWSNKRLAETLDQWFLDSRAIITETTREIVVGKLAAADALTLLDALEALGWRHAIEDDTGSTVSRTAVEPDFEPYKISADKPSPQSGRERVLTNAGMEDWLSRPAAQPILEVCRLGVTIETFGVLLAPWDCDVSFASDPIDADPRKVVKEHLASRSVPADLSCWITKPDHAIEFGDPAFLTWANRSAEMLAMSLSNEYEGAGTIAFKGPPVVRYKLDDAMASAMGPKEFAGLQACARWVFTSPKEMETRHILMTAEYSRFALGNPSAAALFGSASAPALEGAKIAFELGLHKISADSLKALADLRKAVSDEASRLGDSTRQLAAAVSGALFGGIGLVVARLTMSTSSAAVAAGVLLIGFVLCLYVTVTIVSGRQFVSIQRDLRRQWRDRLYRFIPEKEYENLVIIPADRAEAAFKLASWISGVLAAVMMIAVLCVTVPELWESAKAWHDGPARGSDDKPARGTYGPHAGLDDQLIVVLPA